MKKNISLKGNYAISEIVGGLILILVAVITFSVIFIYLYPQGPDYDAGIRIEGFVDENGLVILEHVGGNALSKYRVDVSYTDGTLIDSNIYQNEEDLWSIGEYKYPLSGMYLLTEDDMVQIAVYAIKDKNLQVVFDGVLSGSGSIQSSWLPMLISSLQENTTDEDLLCFNHRINPQIIPLSYIYNWSVDGNPILNMLLPFDTNSLNLAKDYSGNKNNGTIIGPTWTNNSVVGGAYEFNGINDLISLPYCFDSDNYINALTVETWIKTSSDSVAIASFNRSIFWDLGIMNGVARWSTNVNDVTTDTVGATNLIDNTWHYIAATYDSSSGECSIFVDGILENKENQHNPGEELGKGINSTGLIGQSVEGGIPEKWDVLTYDDFESGWGNYTDGGRDCYLYTGGTYAHQGSNAAGIQDDSDSLSSFSHLYGIDVDTPGYISIKVDFWFIAISMEDNEDFWLRYYDGNQWLTVKDYDAGDEFVNGQFYHEIVWINETNYTFPSDMKIRFQCDASYDSDDVYIDQIYVNATIGGTQINNYSGIIDEFKIYNRSLSPEQIYQNYLCMKYGSSDKSVIVSEETQIDETWSCVVTPNDSNQDDDAVFSNFLKIVGYGGGE